MGDFVRFWNDFFRLFLGCLGGRGVFFEGVWGAKKGEGGVL